MLLASEIDMGSQKGLDSIGFQGIHRKKAQMCSGHKENRVKKSNSSFSKTGIIVLAERKASG